MKVPIRNPLDDVYASTFLGSESFINRIWKRKSGLTGQDTRNIPALKLLAKRPSLSEIQEAVEQVIGSYDPHYKKFILYISRQNGGFPLKEVGNSCRMKEAAVSQAVGRFRKAILETPLLKERIQKVLKTLGLSNVET